MERQSSAGVIADAMITLSAPLFWDQGGVKKRSSAPCLFFLLLCINLFLLFLLKPNDPTVKWPIVTPDYRFPLPIK